MQIEKLEIKGFGKLVNQTLEFSKGLNVLFGNNESGKSSTQTFIKAMFFGLKGGRTAKDGELPPVKKYRPWNSVEYSGFMEYRLDNGEVFRVGRNFEENSVRVFDSLFNDITDSFGTGRDKNILFAERHLGVNESCFERTVFIKQMDTRIQDGNKELADKISNLYQTGADDISFKRAEEALKSALKKHVGTERTSTRPMDRILGRLAELNAAKVELMEKRKQMFQLGERLRQTRLEKEDLENKKQALELLLQVDSLQKSLYESQRQKAELHRVLSKLEELDRQLQQIEEQITQMDVERAKLSPFTAYDEEDLEELARDYSGLTAVIQQKEKIKAATEQKVKELQEAQRSYGQVSAFKSLPTDIESKVSELNKDLEILTFQCDRKPLDELEAKILHSQGKVRGIKEAVISAALAAVFLTAGIAGWGPGYVLCTLMVGITGVLLYTAARHRKDLDALLKARKEILADLDIRMKELQAKSMELGEIYERVGAEGYEDFLKRKATCDNRIDVVMALSNQLEQLENESYSLDRRISLLKNSILERLFSVGMAEGLTDEIREEQVKDFRQGFYKYKGLCEKLVQLEQRRNDIENARKELLDLVSGKVQGVPNGERDIKEACRKLEDERRSKQAVMEELLKRAEELCRQQGLEEFIDPYKGQEEGNTTFQIPDAVQQSYEALERRLHDTLLELRELETLVRSMGSDDEVLQKIEEEAAQLQEKRGDLEEKGKALKLALETLEEAGLEIRRDFAPLVNRKMSAVAAQITSGKYENLKVDNELLLKALAPETGDVVPVSALSGGTIDQMYLAMRIALGDVISSTAERMPLVLDEVFSQYDDVRTRETIRYLKALAQERQILFFTCKAREVEMFEEICGEKVNLITL